MYSNNGLDHPAHLRKVVRFTLTLPLLLMSSRLDTPCSAFFILRHLDQNYITDSIL